MKYDTAKRQATKLGAKFLTEGELEVLINSHDHFFPYGCLNCGKAHGESDFTDILYFMIDNGGLEAWAQRNGGSGGYGMIARCRFCGHCDIFAEV